MDTIAGLGIGWAESVWQRRVVDVRPLTGGWTSTMLLLTGDDGEQSVLRLMTREPWRRHAAGLLARESAVQKQLAGSSIPAPRSLAADLSGERAGAPAHLMSRLPGGLRLDEAPDGVVTALAGVLTDIHRFRPEGDKPRTYQTWAPPGKRVVPAWGRRPELWREAFALLEQPAPAYEGTFLHRDFHPGNVLWSPGRITGVVDWVETSWGPAALDVAHAATYLAMLHGPETAIRFTHAYGHHDEHPYWTVMDIVGYLPDPVKVAQPWREAGFGPYSHRATPRPRTPRRLSRRGGGSPAAQTMPLLSGSGSSRPSRPGTRWGRTGWRWRLTSGGGWR